MWERDRLGVCKIWTYKRVSRFCLSEIIDSDSKLGIKSLHERSVSNGCCVIHVCVTRMQSTPEMSAAEMNMVTEKSRKRREKNRQEQNKVRNEEREETGRNFCSTTSCMERGKQQFAKAKTSMRNIAEIDAGQLKQNQVKVKRNTNEIRSKWGTIRE